MPIQTYLTCLFKNTALIGRAFNPDPNGRADLGTPGDRKVGLEKSHQLVTGFDLRIPIGIRKPEAPLGGSMSAPVGVLDPDHLPQRMAG